MLGKISVDEILTYFFLFFQENKIWYFMQIVSFRDNLQKMSNFIFWGKWDLNCLFLLASADFAKRMLKVKMCYQQSL